MRYCHGWKHTVNVCHKDGVRWHGTNFFGLCVGSTNSIQPSPAYEAIDFSDTIIAYRTNQSYVACLASP